jgi:hypothetical protein
MGTENPALKVLSGERNRKFNDKEGRGHKPEER